MEVRFRPVADIDGLADERRMIELRVFKPLDRTTASVELWDGNDLLAEVFAEPGRERRLYLSAFCQTHGLDWDGLAGFVPNITALLDEADAQMQHARQALDGA